MKVEITSCFNKEWWHLDKIGKEYEVTWWSHDAYFAAEAEERGAIIPMKDCIIKN